MAHDAAFALENLLAAFGESINLIWVRGRLQRVDVKTGKGAPTAYLLSP